VKLLSPSLPEIVRDLRIDASRPGGENRAKKPIGLSAYDTDKIELGYLELYKPVFAPLTSKKIKLLEVGVKNGGSLELCATIFRTEQLLASIGNCLDTSKPASAFIFFKATRQTGRFYRKWQIKPLRMASISL
jgi:hypothetical protein